MNDKTVQKERAKARGMRGAAGFTPVTGPGITVTMSDAPREVRESSDRPIQEFVVHQQDIQAVVNAMWDAGARAITIQGQRIISTTGIKCAGNSVELHGIPYPQPYVITGGRRPDRDAGRGSTPTPTSSASAATPPTPRSRSAGRCSRTRWSPRRRTAASRA